MKFTLANIAHLSFFLVVLELDDAIAKRDDKRIIAILDLFLAYWIMRKGKEPA
jgi:hypothetical protein